MMDRDVIPILEGIGTGVTLIEDNWPTHKTEQGEINFRHHHVIHKFLPPWSPDLSWIEKVWANLARRVYANGRVYRSKEELTTVLKAEWELLVGDFDYRRRLVVQAEAACKKVIEHQGYRVHWD